MKKITTIITILTVIFANIILASWFDTDEERKQSMFHDAQVAYKMVLNKEATLSNVLESLQLDITNIMTGLEVADALHILQYINPNDLSNSNEVIQLVLQQHNNTTNQKIKRYVADTMMNLNKEKGIELNKKIINDENYSLSDRLFQADNLVRAGVLVDCDLVKEGLKSKNKSARSNAEMVIRRYGKYDGQVDEKGNKIDVVELINLCSNKFCVPALMKDAKERVLKSRETKKAK